MRGTSPGRTWELDEFDPRWTEFAANPYPFYARLRTEDPAHFVPSVKTWWLTRHADAAFVLGDNRFTKQAPSGAPVQELPPKYKRLLELPDNFLFRDPPDHTRLRALVSKAFTPRVVDGLRPRIQTMANELVEAFASRGRADLLAEFAVPLPAMVIAELLGVPPEDRDAFKEWSDRIVQAMDATQPQEVRIAGLDAQLALLDYFVHLVEKRRRAPGEDLLAGLIAAEEHGDRLSTGELYSTCILLLVAGHETTTNLIGTGILTLLGHPGQLGVLRDDPELMPSAVDELLRYESPVQRMVRWVNEEAEFNGTRIPPGHVVAAVIGAANRDPSVFVDPDRLDLRRRVNPHLGFGRGIHYCLGGPLARAEAETAFAALLRRLPGMALTSPPTWKPNTWIRGLASLPVRF